MESHEVRRGFDAGDAARFGAPDRARMARASRDLCWLFDHGYKAEQAVSFVGNHYLLSKRQRMALTRSLASADAVAARRAKALAEPISGPLLIDGFNCVITLEVALSGSPVFVGLDGALRDLAGLHGTYRIADMTRRAVACLLEAASASGAAGATFYLDRPVSNSGRLKALIDEAAARCGLPVCARLSDDVDLALSGGENVATSDGAVLDGCKSWYNLTGRAVGRLEGVWLYDVRELLPD